MSTKREQKRLFAIDVLNNIKLGTSNLYGKFADRTLINNQGVELFISRYTQEYILLLYSRPHVLLSNLHPEYLDIVRETLALDRLLNTDTVHKYETINTNISGMTLGKAMIIENIYCISQQDLHFYLSDGSAGVEIYCDDNDICPQCKKLTQQPYYRNNFIPVIPNPYCQNMAHYCHLSYGQYVPEYNSNPNYNKSNSKGCFLFSIPIMILIVLLIEILC